MVNTTGNRPSKVKTYTFFRARLSSWGNITGFAECLGLITTPFLKPFLKGKILRSSETGVNSILTTILRF